MLFIVMFSGIANADWTVESSTTFKGETNIYLVSKSADGSEIWIDPQMRHVAYSHKKTVIKGVNGIKIDGKFFDSGGDATGDRLDRAVVCLEDYEKICYQSFFNAKTIEVNVNYFGDYSKVSTFNVNASPGTKEKYYLDSSIEKCKQSKTDYYVVAYEDVNNNGNISGRSKSKVIEFCEKDDADNFFHAQDSQLYSDACGLNIRKLSQLPMLEGVGGVLGCIMAKQCESYERQKTKNNVNATCTKVDWQLNPESYLNYQKYLNGKNN